MHAQVNAPARRRRRNNREAFVCIFAPAAGDATGQGPQVAVAVYARPVEGDATGQAAEPAAFNAASAGGRDGQQGPITLQHPLSGVQ